MAVYREVEPSHLEHDGALYSVNRLLAYAEKKRVQNVELHHMDLVDYTALDAARIAEANLCYPIILLEGNPPYVILDGAHRAANAHLRGTAVLPSVFITAKELESARITL